MLVFSLFNLENPYKWSLVYSIWRIDTNSLINTEKILNKPITKFYNSDDVNLIAGE